MYVEPAVGWNDEDSHVGVKTFGVVSYSGTAHLAVKAPPQRPDLASLVAVEPELEADQLLLQ